MFFVCTSFLINKYDKACYLKKICDFACHLLLKVRTYFCSASPPPPLLSLPTNCLIPPYLPLPPHCHVYSGPASEAVTIDPKQIKRKTVLK